MNNCNCKLIGKISGEKQIRGFLNVGLLDVKHIFQYESKLNFPNVGDVNSLYIATSENAAYRWNENDLFYYCIGRDWQEIELINGGNANG